MIPPIASFILFCVVLILIYKRIRMLYKTVHWDENLKIDETYSALEYDRRSDYFHRL
jgi:hypothetical protein